MQYRQGSFKRIELGLVELSALATLIGSTSAETLTLGLKGASGLPWAAMSFFGILENAKVNLAAAVPYRVREAFGLRITQADLAVGLDFPVDIRKEWRSDEQGTSVCAISMPVSLKEDSKDLATTFRETENNAVARYVYKIDRNTAKVLSVIPPAAAGEEITAHFFQQDDMVESRGRQVTRTDWLGLVATSVKLLEVFTLKHMGSSTVWWATAMPWAHSFISAFSLQMLQKGRDNPDVRQMDILAGELPSALHPGGAGKIILGVPTTLRNDLPWKIVWGSGAIIKCASVVITFLALGSQPPKASYLWLTFQILWLIGRIVAFEVLPSGPVKEGPIVSYKWQGQTSHMQHRVLHLVFGLAKQQVTTHPRRPMFYQEDLFFAISLAELFDNLNWTITEAVVLPETGIEIRAIVGDTLLRSTAWIKGVHIDNSDLYDCSLVFIHIDGRLYAVPSVRILSRIPYQANESTLASNFSPRGTSNRGSGVQWLLWIPTLRLDNTKGWLEITGQKLLSKIESNNVLGNNELQNKLSSGALDVSLTSVEDVERTLGVAQKIAYALMKTVRDAHLL
ncbi:hypothetical protein GP486_003555 [Trichoglossum hirsutum]|uniref:Uncharacterized protein n=1 Tax=Trichoglossum hirsutum TaxID=265104 RepID=A0A9P8LCP6_9PEZI|nr:hypothetical protein GP486_003555 [Trichoglossum hirsutum]